MDVAVLLLFALFFTALAVTTTSRYDDLRSSIRRSREFQPAACGLASLHGALRVPGDDGHGMRMGVLGWTGPLIALVVVTAVVALGSDGNGSAPGSVGSSAGSAGTALAIYSLLVCLISASSLFRRRVRSAIDPREG